MTLGLGDLKSENQLVPIDTNLNKILSLRKGLKYESSMSQMAISQFTDEIKSTHLERLSRKYSLMVGKYWIYFYLGNPTFYKREQIFRVNIDDQGNFINYTHDKNEQSTKDMLNELQCIPLFKKIADFCGVTLTPIVGEDHIDPMSTHINYTPNLSAQETQDRTSKIVTEISIGNSDVVGLSNTSNGRSALGRELLIRRKRGNNKGTSYYSIGDLRNTSSIAIFYDENEIILPGDMQARLMKYVQNKNSPQFKTDFDCASFVHYMLGYYSYKLGNPRLANLEEIINYDNSSSGFSFPRQDLRIGDAIMTANSHDADMVRKKIAGTLESIHWLIYVGSDLYLSKFGSKGPIIVTTLGEVNKLYPYSVIFRVT